MAGPMRCWTIAGAVAAALGLAGGAVAEPGQDPAPVVLEEPSPALGADGVLREHVGFETLGGVLTPVLRKGRRCPCERTVSFTTAVDGQTAIPLRVYRGASDRLEEAAALGSFEIRGIAAQPRGQAHVRVTLRLAGTRLELSATNPRGDRTLPIAATDPARPAD